jgi:hypothetical protein
VTIDDFARETLGRALADAQNQLEQVLAAAGADIARAISDERARALDESARVAADARREIEAAQQQADARIAEMRNESDAKLTHLRAEIQQQMDLARQAAQADVEQVRRLAASEIENACRRANAEAEDLVISQLAAAAADNDRRTREAVEQVTADAIAAESANAQRMLDAIRALDQARSLGEVLDYLAQSAAREVDRAAVLLVKGERLQGWRVAGFGLAVPAARSILLEPEASGIVAVAIREARVATTADGPEGEEALPLFARGELRQASAFPILVDGAPVAVLYGDAPMSSTMARATATLEVLARHVSRALEAMTARQAVGMSLPRPMARPSQPVAAGQESGPFR